MTIDKRYTAPAMPLPPEEYAQAYGDALIKVLRLYFNNNNATVDAIVTLLNNGGYFPSITAGDIDAENITASNLVTDKVTSANAILQFIQAGGISGGDGIFNNLTASRSNAFLFTGNGYQISLPHIAAEDNTDQYADNDNDPTIVKWDTLNVGYGFTLNNDYTATADHPGVYKIDYSLQFANTDNAAHDVYVWLQVDGVDVPGSSSKFTLPARKSVGDYSFIVAYSSIAFEVAANKKIGLWWATDKAYSTTGPVDGVYMEHIAAQTSPPYNRPANPSAVGSIVYVSAPPDPKIQVTPVGAPGVGKVGEVSIDIRNNV